MLQTQKFSNTMVHHACSSYKIGISCKQYQAPNNQRQIARRGNSRLKALNRLTKRKHTNSHGFAAPGSEESSHLFMELKASGTSIQCSFCGAISDAGTCGEGACNQQVAELELKNTVQEQVMKKQIMFLYSPNESEEDLPRSCSLKGEGRNQNQSLGPAPRCWTFALDY